MFTGNVTPTAIEVSLQVTELVNYTTCRIGSLAIRQDVKGVATYHSF